MTEQSVPKPALLCILDGWSDRPERENNAFALANTPNLDRLLAERPRAWLQTSGEAVGLPAGQMGNSEVGHMNLGSGRVVLQDLPKVDAAAKDGSLAARPALQQLIAALKNSGGTCHVMGLLSPGGVHSHQDHIVALSKILADQGIPVAVHGFLDGRDTPPQSAAGFVAQFEQDIAPLPGVQLSTLVGRYYAMDRDKRWDRVAQAYALLVDGTGTPAATAQAGIEASYAEDVTDEFVTPIVLNDYQGMADGDAVLMANFRADRAREILTALGDVAFDGFDRGRVVNFAGLAGMVEYSAAIAEFVPALFPPETLENTLGEIVANAGKTQLRIAETEKYAHVTFFFNGGRELAYDGEERILVPSPKVATYDLQPEMAAPEVTDRLVEAIGSGSYDLIVCNFANPDMVGHTGKLDAAIQAMEAIDLCIGRLTEALDRAGGVMLLSADHGNLEMMVDPHTGAPHTAHTTNDVPLVLYGADGLALQDGCLADVAPTLLGLMGLTQPDEMSGQNLALPAEGASDHALTA